MHSAQGSGWKCFVSVCTLISMCMGPLKIYVYIDFSNLIDISPWTLFF